MVKTYKVFLDGVQIALVDVRGGKRDALKRAKFLYGEDVSFVELWD